MSENFTTPDLSELLRNAMDTRMQSVNVAIPARVQSYDAAKQTVDILPMVRGVVQGVDGEISFEDMPIIPRVPLVLNRVGKFAITFPVEAGDSVLMIACSRDIAQWWRTGQMSDPPDIRTHSIANAVAIPGLYDVTKALPSTSSDSMMLGATDGKQIHIKKTTVSLGVKDASDAVALASKVDNFISKFDAMFRSWTAVPNDGGAALRIKFIEGFASPPASVASAVVKTE